jgi:hypothetical protein
VTAKGYTHKKEEDDRKGGEFDQRSGKVIGFTWKVLAIPEKKGE